MEVRRRAPLEMEIHVHTVRPQSLPAIVAEDLSPTSVPSSVGNEKAVVFQLNVTLKACVREMHCHSLQGLNEHRVPSFDESRQLSHSPMAWS